MQKHFVKQGIQDPIKNFPLNKFTSIVLILFITTTFYGQAIYFKFSPEPTKQSSLPDSLKTIKKYMDLNSIQKKISTTYQTLQKEGYLESKIGPLEKIDDSTFTSQITLGKQIKSIILTAPEGFKSNLFNPDTKSATIPYNNLDSFLNKILNILEQNGNALAKVQLKNISLTSHQLVANLEIINGIKRTINNIIVKENANLKLPTNFLRQLRRKHINKTYNKESLKNIYDEVESLGYAKNSKYPELLLTTDSTYIYLYLEKESSNTFDGFVGFRNSEDQKFQLNGYANIQLQNILKKGEQIHITWKSDGQDQKTFDGNLELPYLFNTHIGLKTQLNIFRQDSTFQNTKTNITLNYPINFKHQINIGYVNTSSNSIISNPDLSINDYSNSFITSGYRFRNFKKRKNETNNEENQFEITIGAGKRNTTTDPKEEKTKQFFTNISWKQTFEIGKKQQIYVKAIQHYLNSNQYLQNELYRYGGFQSIRGFNENSLQASSAIILISEFRTYINQQIYLHSILDYSIAKDKTESNIKPISASRLAAGIGINLLTNNGIFKLAIANGTTFEKKINIQNNIIHLSYTVKF